MAQMNMYLLDGKGSENFFMLNRVLVVLRYMFVKQKDIVERKWKHGLDLLPCSKTIIREYVTVLYGFGQF